MKNKSCQPYTKKRNIIFKNFKEITIEERKEVKSNILLNSAKVLSKSLFSGHKFHLNKGQIPILSKNKKIILIIENKYEKKFQKGKSPFFISDKLNFKAAFKYKNSGKNKKVGHLGLCDYYSKIKVNNLINEDEIESDDSKTPRFNMD